MSKDEDELLKQHIQYEEECWKQRRQESKADDDIWLNMDNADSWGNMLPFETVREFFAGMPTQQIVTLGDSKGGKDARFFKELGHNVTATGVATDSLKAAAERGLIDNWARENAEALTFKNDSFDWAIVKEALHHMQRPYYAVDEMLRVSRKGIILIEPHNQQNYLTIKKAASYVIKRLLAKVTGKIMPREFAQVPLVSYEEPGNYAYKFHPYELSQCAIAKGILTVAYGYAYYFYEKGMEKLTGAAIENYKKQCREYMAGHDKRGGLESRPLLVFFIFKQPIDSISRACLEKQGFRFPVFPENPHKKP